MRHRQFYVEALEASGRDLPLVGGDLMVVSYPENDHVDWELVVKSVDDERLDPAPYQLTFSGPEADFIGSAILVRSDGRSHVFRGAGDLGGFEDGDFEQPLPPN